MHHSFTKALILSLTASLLLVGCSEKSSEPGSAPVSNTIKADIVTVYPAVMAITINVPGSVVAEQQTQIASRIMGFIRTINVDVGQQVVAGQHLLTIDPSEIQGQVSVANATLAQAQAALTDAKNDYQRFGDLYREQAIPKAQWDKVRLQYEIALQQSAAAQAGQNTAGAQMRYATLSAPFAGIITQKMANAGDLAAPGRPLLSLENPAKLQVQAQVSADLFSQLQPGTPVSLHADNVWLTGKVDRLVPAADPVSHTYLVKIALPDPNPLKSGMFVQVGFGTGQRSGLRIPASALLDRAGISGVFVVDRQNIAHYRMVRIGDNHDGLVDIEAGLNPGERVVSSAPNALQSGDKVVNTGAGNV